MCGTAPSQRCPLLRMQSHQIIHKDTKRSFRKSSSLKTPWASCLLAAEDSEERGGDSRDDAGDGAGGGCSPRTNSALSQGHGKRNPQGNFCLTLQIWAGTPALVPALCKDGEDACSPWARCSPSLFKQPPRPQFLSPPLLLHRFQLRRKAQRQPGGFAPGICLT